MKLAIALASVLLAFAAAGADITTNSWEGSIAAGLTLQRGNSRTALGNLAFKATDKWDHNELLFNASATYGTISGEKTTEGADANVQYNRLFTERAYGGLKVDLFHDAIAEISYRLTVAPLAGYYFIKD